MTELSREARELIARARSAEQADDSAKVRIRVALAANLGAPPPPTLPPSADAGAVGALGSGLSASKLVLICSLAAAGVAGTAAVVTTRDAAEHRSVSVPSAREAPMAVAPVGAPAENAPEPSAALPTLAMRDTVPPAERSSPRARPRAGKPAVVAPSEPAVVAPPAPAVVAAAMARAVPEYASETVAPSVTTTASAPPAIPSIPSMPSSSWQRSNLPTPIPDREASELSLAARRHPECSAERELELLSVAQTALRESRGEQAMDVLEQHARICPAAKFWEERNAARVLALCLLHRERQAVAEATQLASLAPRSPLLARLRTSCAAAALDR